jgi:hypothetical protein
VLWLAKEHRANLLYTEKENVPFSFLLLMHQALDDIALLGQYAKARDSGCGRNDHDRKDSSRMLITANRLGETDGT